MNNKAEIKEDDVVLCTVTGIEGTSVSVRIEGNGEGSIVTSEISPGRIRNIRDYVIPNKKIVCKVLRIDSTGNINLSLRRVKASERKEVMDKFNKEKSSENILKTILKDKANPLIAKIQGSVVDFLEQVKNNPKLLEKYATKTEIDKLLKILNERKTKEVKIKKEIFLQSCHADGLKRIKKILSIDDAEITYIAAGRYLVQIKAKNFKEGNPKMSEILDKIEEEADKQDADFKAK